MRLEDVQALTSADGQDALAAAATLAASSPLVAAEKLRAQGFSPALAAAALTQAELRRRAVAKFGPDAQLMLFTRAGLEQATRAPVARRRAERLAAAGARRVADLGCGVGADTIAFARAGLRVLAVDADPVTSAVTAANVKSLELDDVVLVEARDATETPLVAVEAVFCDPARRTSGGRRVFDPRAYSPPWDFVTALPARVSNTVLKLAPGIDHALLPKGAEGEWVSVDGDVVEAAAWCGPLAEVPRRATLHRGDQIHELTGGGDRQAPVGPVGAYLYDPDGAVVRSHLVAELAEQLDGHLLDESIAYVTTGSDVPTPFARKYEIIDRLPIALKKLRAALRERGVGALQILKRGSAHDVDELRRQLRLEGGASAFLALTRIAGEPAALLLRPADGPGGAAGR
ncbi:class I SAM-dependent methyltransferase [Dactylosporangium vinaceum]|uniref:SAM-dependent methyltransferase n=1 Tax=Dactylosporangium vinaceum TaxID=53362 RepID=A0ABV5M5B2_9ACTN|nr:class I SAM-dependent methyltransferase [Dactylosporangium vinaceum]UAB95922.1 class I SAM-dependent methyltransferase [Dactylosporangium vinaceum]